MLPSSDESFAALGAGGSSSGLARPTQKVEGVLKIPGLAIIRTLPLGSSAAGRSAMPSESGKSGPGVQTPVFGCRSRCGRRRNRSLLWRKPTVVPQDPGPHFERGETSPAAIRCGVPELHRCAPAGTCPLARRGIVELELHSGRVVLNRRRHRLSAPSYWATVSTLPRR